MHRFDENVHLDAGIEPTATRTAAAANGSAYSMAKYNNFAAIIYQAGATQYQSAVTYQIMEGTTSTQFSATALATVTLSSATTHQVDSIEIRAEEMTDAYTYVRAIATPAGGTANAIAIVSAQFNPRYSPAV